MTGAARKMATVVVFGLLMSTVSAARVTMLSSPTSAEHMGRSSLAPITTSSSTPARSTVHTDSVIGCTPKKLARDLVLYCRDPVNARMPIEACCMVAVGTVGRPSCYCLVKEEAAFGMSPLFNVSNMLHLLARCGASIDLNRSVNNPCDRPYHDKESAECASPQMTPKTGTCNTTKISAYVAWVAVAVLAGFLAWIVFCQPAPATQVVYVPDIQMVRPIENHNEDQGPRTSDASAGDARGNDSSSDTESEASEDDVSQASENPMLDVSHISKLILEGKRNCDVTPTSELILKGKRNRRGTTTSELILEGKRNRRDNPRIVGGPWVNK